MIKLHNIIDIINKDEGIIIDNKMQYVKKVIIDDERLIEYINNSHPEFILSGSVLGFKYEIGGFLDWHRDDMYGKGYDMTGGIVLNDNYTGGVFQYEDGTVQDQTVGKPFTLTRTILHRVTKITSGNRYSLHYKLNSIKNKSMI